MLNHRPPDLKTLYLVQCTPAPLREFLYTPPEVFKVMLACIAQHTHERHVVGGIGLGDLSMDKLPS